MRIKTWPFVVAALALLLCTQSPLLRIEAVRAAEPLELVAFGDSLTAGYGLKKEDAFPEQLERALTARGRNVKVINAGVSGDTTSAGLARLEWAVPKTADAVIIELGANDALRGQDPERAFAALDQIITRLKERGHAVLLAGMEAPRNMGAEYNKAFNGIYPRLAARHDVPLYPFFLDGVAGSPELNLPDGIHPTGPGITVIVERILPYVEKLLEAREAGLLKKAG